MPKIYVGSILLWCLGAMAMTFAAPATAQYGTCYKATYSPCIDCPEEDSATCVTSSSGSWTSCTIIQSSTCPGGTCDYAHYSSGPPCPIQPK